MVNSSVAVIVTKAREKADQGIDYTPRCGAVCPECGQKRMKIMASKPWKDGVKIRYHKCGNKAGRCLLALMETSIKSVQIT